MRQTARQQWRLLAANLGGGLVQAFGEGATLAVVFLAVEVLSAPVGQPIPWATMPIIGRVPAAVALLAALPASGVVVVLLAVAVLLKAYRAWEAISAASAWATSPHAARPW